MIPFAIPQMKQCPPWYSLISLYSSAVMPKLLLILFPCAAALVARFRAR